MKPHGPSNDPLPVNGQTASEPAGLQPGKESLSHTDRPAIEKKEGKSGNPTSPAQWWVQKIAKQPIPIVRQGKETETDHRGTPHIIQLSENPPLYRGVAPFHAVGIERYRITGSYPGLLDSQMREDIKHFEQVGELVDRISRTELHAIFEAVQDLNIPLGDVEGLRRLLRLGKDLTLACVKYDPAQPVEQVAHDIIEFGGATVLHQTRTLAEGINEYLKTLSAPRKNPLRKTNHQRAVMKSVGNRVMAKLGLDKRLVDLLKDPDALREYIEKIDQEHQTSYPQNFRRLLRGVIKVAASKYGIHALPGLIPKYLAKSNRPVKAVRPDVIRKLLLILLREAPEFLLFALVQVGAGLRPEEAYQLHGSSICLVDGLLKLPGEITKGNSQRPRRIRLRPWVLAWLSLIEIPEGAIAPLKKDGTIYCCQEACKQLNDFIRLAGWVGFIGKEPLRKSFCSAAKAIGQPLEPIYVEVGHLNPLTFHLHYDANWSRHTALDYYLNFPPNYPLPTNLDDPNLWAPASN